MEWKEYPTSGTEAAGGKKKREVGTRPPSRRAVPPKEQGRSGRPSAGGRSEAAGNASGPSGEKRPPAGGKENPRRERRGNRRPQPAPAREYPPAPQRGKSVPPSGNRREEGGAKVRPQKRKRGLRPGFFLGLGLVLAGVLVVLSLTVLFPVREITVEGETRYTAQQIIQVSALETGENLLLTDTQTAADRILRQLPYIGEVTISRRLPGTLVIEAVESDPVYALEQGETYLLLNQEHKVVETRLARPEGLLLLRGITAEPAEPGDTAVFTDEGQSDVLRALTRRLGSQETRLTLVDLRDMVNIRFVLDNRLLVELGSSTDLEDKLTHLLATWTQLGEDETGTLDLRWWTSGKKEAYVRAGELGEEWLVPETAAPAESGDPVESDQTSDASPAASQPAGGASAGETPSADGDAPAGDQPSASG